MPKVEVLRNGYQAYVRVWNDARTATTFQSEMMGIGEAKRLAREQMAAGAKEGGNEK